MLKYKILYGVMLLWSAAVFVFANSAAAMLLLVLMIILPVVIKLSVADNASKIQISTSMSDACVVGSEAQPIEVKVENKSILPMGNIEIVLEYQNHMFGTKYTDRVSLCGARRESVFKIPISADCCGRSEVVIKEVYCCDVLNMMKNRIEYSWKKAYTVYPKLPDMQLHAQKLLAAEFGGQNYDRNRRGNDNSEVFQVREYEQGDNLSAAHWKLSAKQDNIIIREWSRPNNFRLLLVFDLVSEDIKGNKVSGAEISAIIGLTASVSRELAYQSIGHNAEMINCGPRMDMSIDRPDDSDVLLDDIMSIHIPKNNNTLFNELVSGNTYNNYSKLVYIGPKANADVIKTLSSYMDVTIIAVKSDGKITYEQELGGSVYTVPASAAETGLDFIEL